jgi:hypothetical protein
VTRIFDDLQTEDQNLAKLTFMRMGIQERWLATPQSASATCRAIV